jgi:hypothetical protein
MNKWHWVYVKKEDNAFIQERVPRNKFYVEETTERIDFFGQHVIHYLDLYNKEYELIRKCDMESFCGYDRGPKLRNLIRNMILNGIGGKYSN